MFKLLDFNVFCICLDCTVFCIFHFTLPPAHAVPDHSWTCMQHAAVVQCALSQPNICHGCFVSSIYCSLFVYEKCQTWNVTNLMLSFWGRYTQLKIQYMYMSGVQVLAVVFSARDAVAWWETHHYNVFFFFSFWLARVQNKIVDQKIVRIHHDKWIKYILKPTYHFYCEGDLALVIQVMYVLYCISQSKRLGAVCTLWRKGALLSETNVSWINWRMFATSKSKDLKVLYIHPILLLQSPLIS